MLGAMALEASLSLLEEVGMQQVGNLLEERMQHLQQGLQRIPGVTLHSPLLAERRAGILTFSLNGWDKQALFARLREDQVICAQRGAGIRLSPHFYTNHAVIDQTLALLGQLAQS